MDEPKPRKHWPFGPWTDADAWQATAMVCASILAIAFTVGMALIGAAIVVAFD